MPTKRNEWFSWMFFSRYWIFGNDWISNSFCSYSVSQSCGIVFYRAHERTCIAAIKKTSGHLLCLHSHSDDKLYSFLFRIIFTCTIRRFPPCIYFKFLMKAEIINVELLWIFLYFTWAKRTSSMFLLYVTYQSCAYHSRYSCACTISLPKAYFIHL